jgi:hypothetical protein
LVGVGSSCALRCEAVEIGLIEVNGVVCEARKRGYHLKTVQRGADVQWGGLPGESGAGRSCFGVNAIWRP